MGLADYTPPEGPGWQECGVAYALRNLSAEDADTLRAWLGSTAQHAWIARTVTKETGVPLKQDAVARHRAAECKC